MDTNTTADDVAKQDAAARAPRRATNLSDLVAQANAFNEVHNPDPDDQLPFPMGSN